MLVVLFLLVTLILVLILELVIARRGTTEDFANPSQAARSFAGPSLTKLLVVLGDSTAAGQGADYEASIAVSSAQHLATRNQVELVNLATSGATMQQVLTSQLSNLPAKPDVVLISVGSNDVTHFSRIGFVSASQLEIIQQIKATNCHAKIVITGSAAVDTVPRLRWPLNLLVRLQVTLLNRRLQQIANDQKITWAPIADATRARFSRDHSLFAADDFHPNALGYAVWAKVINQALDEAANQPDHCG